MVHYDVSSSDQNSRYVEHCLISLLNVDRSFNTSISGANSISTAHVRGVQNVANSADLIDSIDISNMVIIADHCVPNDANSINLEQLF